MVERTRDGAAVQGYHLLMLVVTFFWAVGHPLGNIILREVHPFQLGSVNLILGFFGVFLFLVISGQLKKLRQFSFRDIIHAMVLGMFGFFSYQICTFSALNRIPASINAVLVSTNAIFIVVVAAIVFKEKINLIKAVGVLVAAGGVVFVVFNRGFRLEGDFNYWGVLYSFGAVFSFTAYSIGGRNLLRRKDPVIVTALAMFSGMVFLSLFTGVSVGFDEVFSASRLTIILMIGLSLGMIGIAYPLWFYCLKQAKSSEVAVFIYLVPVYAGILSYFILRELFGWRFYFGGVLILTGIFLNNFIGNRKRRSADSGQQQPPGIAEDPGPSDRR